MEQEQKIDEKESIEEALELILYQVPECYVYMVFTFFLFFFQSIFLQLFVPLFMS